MGEDFRKGVVDDSEPEREELRQKVRKLRKNFKSNGATRGLEPSLKREVIEITDDESDTAYIRASSVIDISGIPNASQPRSRF